MTFISLIPPIYYNVKQYGALGDGSTDDTTAIAAAISAATAAGGGIVFFPVGTYKITNTLTLNSHIGIHGASDGGATIHMTATNKDCFAGVDLTSNSFRDITLLGPGSGTGKGINLTRSSDPAITYLSCANLTVQSFGSDGISISNPIVSTFSRVRCDSNGGYGFNFFGVISGAAGTSLALDACFANGNTTGGYRLYNMAYCGLVGCAADNQPISYLIDTCQSIALVGCGSEGNTTNAFKITGGYGITLSSPWVYDNHADAMYITGSAHTVTIIGATDNTPHSGATSFIKTDSGTNVALLSCNNTTANSLASGTVTTVVDNAGNATIPGTLHMNNRATIKFGTADDTDLYRLGSNSLATDGLFTAWGGANLQSLSVGQSSSALAVASSGTITTSGVGVARVSPTGAVTGVILQAGTVAGQTVTVVNEAVAANTVTFAAAATSNVSDGTSSVIAGLAARQFVWDSSTSRWYPCK